MEDPQETKYDKEIKTYYDNKLLSQTRSRYAKCSGCETNKTFTSKDGYLVYSCGGRSGKCGPQTKIRLAQYIYYPDTLRDTNKGGYCKVQGRPDKIFRRGNQQSSPYIKLPDERILDINDTNEMSDYFFDQSQNENLSPEMREFMDRRARNNDYIQSVKKLESDYLDLQKSFEKISPFIVVKPGSVTQLH